VDDDRQPKYVPSTRERRGPSLAELRILNDLIAAAGEAAPALALQVIGADVSPNCTCGCGSFDVYSDETARPLESSRDLPELWDKERGIGILLMLMAGRVSGVEITYFTEEFPPAGIPDSSRLTAA
jgi:hypothetical protein